MSDYAATSSLSSREQVTSITQFSDVYPTDWAYQALSNLIERYGCVAGYPNGTYRGNRAMTRFEAAALLNACLDRVTEVTDELKRLMKEFEKELAILKGRVDGLEARVGELEATQFSTTTKLKGQATFVIGANRYYGSNGLDTWSATNGNRSNGATTFNYNVNLSVQTSFTGKDLLNVRLRGANFQNSSFANQYLPSNVLAVAYQEPGVANTIGIDALTYSFPVGKSINIGLGPMVALSDPNMLAIWPSVYTTEPILMAFAFAGAPGAYNFNPRGGALGITLDNALGVDWLKLSSSYISGNSGVSNSTPGGDLYTSAGRFGQFYTDSGGIGTAASSSTWTNQVAITGEQLAFIGGGWGLAAVYAYSQNLSLPTGTPLAVGISQPNENYPTNSSNNIGVSGYWQPEQNGWIPSLSFGYGFSQLERAPYKLANRPEVQSWMVGMEWRDAFYRGNTLGSAIGQIPYVTNSGAKQTNNTLTSDQVRDSNLLWEAWYRWQITDNIAITPAVFYGWQVGGDAGRQSSNGLNKTLNNLGGLIKTSFNF